MPTLWVAEEEVECSRHHTSAPMGQETAAHPDDTTIITIKQTMNIIEQTHRLFLGERHSKKIYLKGLTFIKHNVKLQG